ncbi:MULTISPECIES: helix-turn-helix transcriptional regulator [unclassified Streptomyces]|uniref:helix-turn-helix transcriptional regulator n=1 Tax=unclassified Streptomyces TaxID=2593676 RepID=UPI001874F1A7|nr:MULTISPECIES: helix-turn-helix transcriptional regulator [unclassified Streptomyces]QZZ29208.1 helix-turn-helix transcriptional regulator [Streptomyces sp. ST1015]
MNHREHGAERLCAAGRELYGRALHEGWIAAGDAQPAPCLVQFGLLHPTPHDLARLEPVAPAVALHRLLDSAESRIAEERRREAELVDSFEPLLRIAAPRQSYDTPALRILSGTERINQALDEALLGATRELLSVQPHTPYSRERIERARAVARPRDQALLDHGGRIRTLYQHTQRHSLGVLGYTEQLKGDVECRSLDEVTDRLMIVDRTVAFIPADDDGRLALEIRHPALVKHFVTTFDRLWRLATPMHPEPVAPRPSLDGVTARQRAIAALLIEGHTDAVIADRLGLNIRTAREHIAKLAATLGSDSRAQLGYLIGQSGILDREE